MEDERLISSVKLENDENENLLRPKAIDEYVGQEKARRNNRRAKSPLYQFRRDRKERGG